MPSSFLVDADAVLDYKFDWASLTNGSGVEDWLEAGETITEIDVSASGVSLGDGVVVVSSSAGNVTPDAPALADTNTSVIVWIYSPTAGSVVTCRIRTSSGRVDDRSVTFLLR